MDTESHATSRFSIYSSSLTESHERLLETKQFGTAVDIPEAPLIAESISSNKSITACSMTVLVDSAK